MSEKKTSESQLRAVKSYRERNPQKNFTATMSLDEYNKSMAVLSAHGLTPLQAFRRLISELEKDIPTMENEHKEAEEADPRDPASAPDEKN